MSVITEYRIPTIDEFVNGFIYHVYTEGLDNECIEDFCGWYTYTVGKTCWRDKDQIKKELKQGKIHANIIL